MKDITAEYLSRAELGLLITLLVYFLMNGAQLFETAVIIPKWSKNPPASLSMIQGPFAPDLKTFWIAAHAIHEITFLLAIGFCWRVPQIRNALILVFVIHFLVRLWTIGYFAPRIMAFQKTDFSNVDNDILQQVKRWTQLNYIRVAAFCILSIAIVMIFAKLKSVKPPEFVNKNNKIMEQRLSVITLGVNNLSDQKEFYKTKLGWKPVAENKDIVFFKLNGFLFSLLDKKTLAEGSGVNAEGNGFRALTISYNVPSKEKVDELYRELKSKNVKIFKEPSPTPFGGYFFTFSDLEQNVLEVAFNPYIPLDDSGNVITHNNIDNL